MNAKTISLSGKADTLAALQSVLRTAEVLPQVKFLVADWLGDKKAVLERLNKQPWAAAPLIVRSSAVAEDRMGQSLAGHFRSIGNVAPGDVAAAIAEVAASFGDVTPQDAIFIQPMLTAVALSGVAFTQDPNTGAPYLVINYEESGDTAAVTGGRGQDLRTFVYWKGAAVPCKAPFDRIAALCDELEKLFGQGSLDLEFAVTADGRLILLQVRPLAAATIPSIAMEAHRTLLKSVAEKIGQMNRPHPYLRGKSTLYGIMPDWNPAEIIGIRPRPLALSLYRNLITDSVWAYQRNNYGYRNLRSFPLMLSFHGLPYIDVRVSFNSFIPSDVNDELADRLVDSYIEQ